MEDAHARLITTTAALLRMDAAEAREAFRAAGAAMAKLNSVLGENYAAAMDEDAVEAQMADWRPYML